MSKQYQISVDQKFIFDLNEDDVKQLSILSQNESVYHLLDGYKSIQANVKNADFLNKKYLIEVNNTEHEVQISNALDLLIKDLGFSLSQLKTVNEIKAPMPGLILEIAVKVGQEVQENELLLILEAMKMENSFQSPRAGIIKNIAVSKGDAVDKGQLLIEFES